MDGILLIDKPLRWTSQDVASKLKRVLQVKKIGHAGTLDPLATGLLVILLGEGTKLSNYLLCEDKTYLATISIGTATNTEDSDGEVIEQKKVLQPLDVDTVLDAMIGHQKQMPPMFSAIKQNGKKLYELARQGITVTREERDIEIKALKRMGEVLYKDDCAEFTFICDVTKGTYIRTLCTDIGKRLGYPAHMSGLRRLRSGCLNVEESFRIDDVIAGNFKVISCLDALKNFKTINVDEKQYHLIKNGVPLTLDCCEEQVVFAYNNKLVAIYQKEKNIYKASRIWN